MFQGRWPSYRKLTLEFLSSLRVNKNRRSRIPESIDFRLGNRNHSLTMEELCAVFHCFDPNPDEDVEFYYSDVWKAMTIDEEEHKPGYAKSSSIRNPVFRYLHRAMTQLMFARVDGGSVSQTELNVMWCLLTKRGFNFGIFFTHYVDRLSKKDGGVICCGGLITAIAEHLGISTTNLHEDMGERFITYEVLFSVGLLKTDVSGQGFFLQVERDHFPVPIPHLTKVDVWDNQVNWKLNTPVHRRAIEANPISGEFRKRNIPSRLPNLDPNDDSAFDAIDNYQKEAEHSQARGSGAPQRPPEIEEDEEEDVEVHRRRTRANRRRGRPNANEEFQANTSAQLGDMFSYMQNMSNTWDNRWAKQQQENAYNRQGWAAQDEWRTVEQDFWEHQRLEDVHQCREIAKLHRMAAEAQQECQTMSGDIAYLIGAFDDLNARFPPPPQD